MNPGQGCCRVASCNAAQRLLLEQCVDEHKWYLSERAHCDVGWDAALDSFCEKYFNGFAAGFRACYCGLVCENRQNCELAKRYLPRGN